MTSGRIGAVQSWLETTVQGHLLGTEYGRHPDDREPDWLVANGTLRERAIEVTLELIARERCARDTTAGLVGVAPDVDTKVVLATQIFDETRHLEVFGARLHDLGVGASRIDDVLGVGASGTGIREVGRTLFDAIEQRDFAAGIFGLNVVFEPLALRALEQLHDAQADMNPKFARTLAGVIADERRHVGFGERCVRTALHSDGTTQGRLERMRAAITPSVLSAMTERPATSLDRSVLIEELNMRLTRLGIASGVPVQS